MQERFDSLNDPIGNTLFTGVIWHIFRPETLLFP